jgi:hypothetical protein
MPLIYKKPKKWDHHREFNHHCVGNLEREALKKLLDEIPLYSEVQIIINWSKNATDKCIDELGESYGEKRKSTH